MNNEIGYFVLGIEMAMLEVVESHVDSLHTNPKCNDQQTKEEFLELHIGSLSEKILLKLKMLIVKSDHLST